MDSKPAGGNANLKQYRAVNGKWQFVPVVKRNGKPKPELALIEGMLERSFTVVARSPPVSYRLFFVR